MAYLPTNGLPFIEEEEATGEVAELYLHDVNGDGRDDVIQLHRSSGDVSLRLVSSALRYRAQAPLLDHLLGEIGIDAGDPSKIAHLLGELKKDRPKGAKEK